MQYEKKEKRRISYEYQLFRIKNQQEKINEQKKKQQIEQKYKQDKKNME